MKSKFQQYLLSDLFQNLKVSKFNSSLGFKFDSSYKISSISDFKFYSPGDHLLFLNPTEEQCETDNDGYYSYQSPSKLIGVPFTRRMWTQGSMDFHAPLEDLKEYKCLEVVKYVKTIGKNTFVNIDRIIYDDSDGSQNNKHHSHDHKALKLKFPKFVPIDSKFFDYSKISNVLVKENRSLLYTNEPYTKPLMVSDQSEKGLATYTDLGREFSFNEDQIAKYGQYTNNPHKIHLDSVYCRENENLHNVIVPGPLSIQTILGALKYSHHDVKSFKYKNTKPIFANDKMKLIIDEARQNIKVIDPIDFSVYVDATYKV